METQHAPHPHPLTLGISSCLLGEEVRFDGNHKRDAWIVGSLGRWFEFHPVCPEMAIGLGVPRPPIRLQGDPDSPQVVGVRDETLDVTEELEEYSRETAAGLEGLSGYILKAKSPSCGMERVKVYRPGGGQPRMGQGVFARALMEAHPELPVEEEGRLGDPDLRDNFLERVFAHHRWQALQAEGLTPARLQDFHRRHKLTLMAHGQEHYRRLGQRVAAATGSDIETAGAEYFRDFMGALRHKATRRRHVNVLQHIMGYLKRDLEPGDKAELLEVFERFRQELVPLSVPLTLLKHHFRHHPSDYMADQVYLDPYPAELMLR
jgi:uncharacterized protein YbgA (DUF1722 family)/uncharacterized protein YbbK (DUF523 family)